MSDNVTCSFTADNIENCNAETMLAIKEVQELKKDPNKKTYDSFSEIPAESEAEGDLF